VLGDDKMPDNKKKSRLSGNRLSFPPYATNRFSGREKRREEQNLSVAGFPKKI
jgi:hypothetical protein